MLAARLAPRKTGLAGGRQVASTSTPRPTSTLITPRAKKGIHPEVYDDAKVICNGEEVLVVSGTKAEYVVDVWSGNHPFYTGALTQTVAEESRIAQFQKKYGGMYGAVAPVSAGGNTKLDYKKPEKGKKGGKK